MARGIYQPRPRRNGGCRPLDADQGATADF